MITSGGPSRRTQPDGARPKPTAARPPLCGSAAALNCLSETDIAVAVARRNKTIQPNATIATFGHESDASQCMSRPFPREFEYPRERVRRNAWHLELSGPPWTIDQSAHTRAKSSALKFHQDLLVALTVRNTG